MIRLAASLLLLSGSAFADDCVGSPDIVAACEEARVADDALNAAYRALLQRLDHPPAGMESHHAGAKASLIEAQRAWLKFRELDCAATFDLADGTSGSALAMSCEAMHARLRTEQLKAMTEGL